MTAMLIRKILPQYYKLVFFRKLQNIKEKLMIVRDFTEEFYNVNIRSGHIEDI